MYAKYLVLLLLQQQTMHSQHTVCIASISLYQLVYEYCTIVLDTYYAYVLQQYVVHSSTLEYVVLESYTMYTTSQQLCTLRLLQLEYSRTKYGNFSRSMDGRSVDTVYYQITSLISTLVVVVAVLEYAMIMDITLLYALTTSQYAPSCSGRSRAVGDVCGSDCSVYPYYTLVQNIRSRITLASRVVCIL